MSGWHMALQQFVDECVERQSLEPEYALLEFATILGNAPAEYAALFDNSVSIERLRELCALQAYLCAAIELVGPYCGILVTRSAGGSSSALVSISDEVEEGNFFGNQPAVALLAAYARALLALGASPPHQ